MRTVRTVEEVRAALCDAGTIGLVPTMGALHEGHVELIRRARTDSDTVVVSLFVNPAQFGPGEDLAAYPRDEAADGALAAGAGADLLFAPGVKTVYPPAFATTVSVGGVTEQLEGAKRPGHFDGVATVVCKLLNMVGPHVAYFGQKDAQQVAVVKTLVRDLDMPVRIEVIETVREPDGLALSSRNRYLEPDDRHRAAALKRALDATATAVRTGAADPVAAGRAELSEYGIDPEYLVVVDPMNFTKPSPDPDQTRADGDLLVAVAARVGRARLIDNVLIPSSNGSH